MIKTMKLDVIQRLKGVPQSEKWHPEGDVFRHTMQVVALSIKYSDMHPELNAQTIQNLATFHDAGKISSYTSPY